MTKKPIQQCNDIVKLRTDFNGYRDNTNSKLEDIKNDSDSFRDGINNKIDDIMVQLKKPIFTPYQAFGIFVVLVGYMGTIMVYGGDINSDVKVHSVKIENIENSKSTQIKQYEKIINTLDIISIDVAVLKSEQKNK